MWSVGINTHMQNPGSLLWWFLLLMLSSSCLLYFFSLRKCFFFIPALSTLHAPRKNWSRRHVGSPAYFKNSLIKFSHVINLCWQFSICLARMTSERGREGGRGRERGFIGIWISGLQFLMNIQPVWCKWDMFEVLKHRYNICCCVVHYWQTPIFQRKYQWLLFELILHSNGTHQSWFFLGRSSLLPASFSLLLTLLPPPWTCFHSPLGAWSWFSPIFLAFCGPLTHCQITTFNLLSLRGWKLSPVTPFPSPQIFPSWLILGSLLDLPYTTEMSIIQAIIGSFLNQVSNWWWSYLEVSTR